MNQPKQDSTIDELIDEISGPMPKKYKKTNMEELWKVRRNVWRGSILAFSNAESKKAVDAFKQATEPNYLSLEELANDPESIEKIFNFVMSIAECASYGNYEKKDDHIVIAPKGEDQTRLIISNDGQIVIMEGEEFMSVPNIFKVIDFIRSLGYSPKNDQ